MFATNIAFEEIVDRVLPNNIFKQSISREAWWETLSVNKFVEGKPHEDSGSACQHYYEPIISSNDIVIMLVTFLDHHMEI